LTVWLIYNAADFSKPLAIIILLWLALQAVVSLSGFYTVTNVLPPRFALLLLPPVVVIVSLFFFKKGRDFIDGFRMETLTLLQMVRIPVELTLYWLFLHKTVPELMTFTGRNFDILCGLTAPVVYYFAFVQKLFGRTTLMAWNIVCLLPLANIVRLAVLSAPFPFQQFAFNQPSIALFYFPFVWLPCCIVPIVLLAHLVSIRKLIISRQ
jgi:hypothetical protein